MVDGSASKTAFVLAGGGSLGAVQVGMLETLVEHPAVLRPAARQHARSLPKVELRLDLLQSDAADDGDPWVRSGRRSDPVNPFAR